MGKRQKKLITNFWKTVVEAFSTEEKAKVVPFVLEDDKCYFCLCKKASWRHEILKQNVCSDCVPRGCSCTLRKVKGRTGLEIQDYEYILDKYGNDIPCKDWKRI